MVMPSSYYAAEKLTGDIIKSVLKLVVGGGGKPREQVISEVSRQHAVVTDPKHANKETRRLVSFLKHRGYVAEDKRGLTSTDKGTQRLQELELQELRLSAEHTWDGKWRILTFDIPEDQRAARNAVRRLIKQMGFAQLHRSVWIHPLPCREYIQLIQDAYGVKEHITLLEVDYFDQKEVFQKKFQHLLTQSS